MKPTYIFSAHLRFYIFPILIALCSESCRNAPAQYETAEAFFQEKRFDSAFIHFNKVPKESGSWQDSALKMQSICFKEMARLSMWKMLGSTFQFCQKDEKLFNTGSVVLSREIFEHLKSGRAKQAFDAADNYSGVLPKDPVLSGINLFLDDFLTKSNWEAGGDLKGHTLYFTRVEFITKHTPSKGLLLQGKSRNTVKSWHEGRVIYRNLRYESGGKFRLEPLIIREEDYEYGDNGSMEILGRDSIKINYGQKLSASSTKKIFVRAQSNKENP